MTGLLVIFALVWVVQIADAGWVDPDTPADKRQLKNLITGETFDLVMSDEFERSGRKFKNGYDPMWTGIDRSDDDQTSQGRKSLQFYNSSYISTANGTLIIKTSTEDTKWKGWNPYKKKYETMVRHFRSGMLQSWNKFCYTGGILEVDVQFPGRHDIGGLWPAVWLLGNLGRATFEASTNLLWPWSYETCDRDLQRAQEISGCDITSHFGLNNHQGRGATEIDIIEVMPGPSTLLPIVKRNLTRPYSSMTLQIAPGIPVTKRRPFPGTLPEWGFTWYSNVSYGERTSINPFFYGTYLAQTKASEPIGRSKSESYQCDAISSMVQLDDSYFKSMHTFRLEWEPGYNGSLHWYVDNVKRFSILGEGLLEHGTMIPNEPSYVILNTAISTSWGFPNPPPGCTEYDCKNINAQCGFNPGFCKTLPAEFKVDHVRIYQNKNNPKHTVGCNPKEYPTKRFILAHEYRYKGSFERHALAPVVKGKAHCARKPAGFCGEGECVYDRCQCKDGWTGPTCLMPDHQNDEPDWDSEDWIPYERPYVPSFLFYAFGVFSLAVMVTAWYIMQYRKKLLHEVQPYTVLPNDEETHGLLTGSISYQNTR